jgi:hypothetical protein
MALSLLSILLSLLGIFFVTNTFAQVCIDCHKEITPGILSEWKISKHNKKGINCTHCHGDKHVSRDDVEKAQIPTPDTCAVCHEKQFKQFMSGKHSLAWQAMKALPLAHWQHMALMEGVKGCTACHKIGVKSVDEMKGLKKTGQVYGNVSCDSCHTRHAFSVKEAQQPQSCQTCHMGGDHPQWEMYSGSKHGVRYFLKQSRILPEDTAVPTCQTCHMQEGDHFVRAAWGFFGVRLPLPEDTQWAAAQAMILNALGVLTPDGKPTASFGIVKAIDVARFSKEEWQKDRDRMLHTCRQCHSLLFAKSELEKGDTMIRAADRLMAEALLTVAALSQYGLVRNDVSSGIEQKLFEMFQQRMMTFQGTFHANPDYALWYGWSKMQRSLIEIKEMATDMLDKATVREKK